MSDVTDNLFDDGDEIPAPRHPVRPWTPDQFVSYPSGETGRRLSVKRACSTCGEKVGDVTDLELIAVTHIRPRGLLPITDECWKCRGFHAVFADPSPRSERWRAGDPDTWEIKLLCPGRPPGQAALPCASWQQCGCVPTGEPLSPEFEAFLARPCPASPTGEHRYIADRGWVGAPTGPCVYQAARDVPVAALGVVSEPGIYPVNPVLIEPDLVGYEWIDLRQRDAMPAVG